ncbi:MAG: hypothetical protein KIT68_13520, partial [Phycisphaeraceae bacterium]|nr:hypothetical protein [Phycisphaeraceae bacterium]
MLTDPQANMGLYAWKRDHRGNVTRQYHAANTAANATTWPAGIENFSGAEGSVRASAYGNDDRETSSTSPPRRGVSAGSGYAATPTPLYDRSGNQITDGGGRFIFTFDARGQLRQVWKRQVNGAKSDLFARLDYNGLGQLVRAVYDLTPAAGETDATRFDNETVETYLYDDQWRLVAIQRQGPVGSGGATPPARPDP